jgi:uncharacterized protein (DUF1330 family)
MNDPESGRLLNLDQMRALLARRTEGPVRMVNLLKFKPDGGRASYMRYAEATAPLVAKVGGSLVYAGTPAELLIGDQTWDLFVLVEYPTRQAFLDMVSAPEYQATEHLRHEALERSVLYATDPLRQEGGPLT